MRLILLLSALLSAFAAGVSPARAAGVPTVQVVRLVDVVAARAAVATAGRRPVFVTPSVADVVAAPASAGVTAVATVPLYANRLRT
jgi:hypothetical protein